MTELEAAQQKRIAGLEEELAVLTRQLAALTRYVFGKRSEQTPPPVAGQQELHLDTETDGPPAALPTPPDKPKGGSRKGRKVRAQLLSLIGSCRRRGLNPRAYLQWLFTRIAAEGTHAPHTLTPAVYAALTKPETVPAQAA